LLSEPETKTSGTTMSTKAAQSFGHRHSRNLEADARMPAEPQRMNTIKKADTAGAYVARKKTTRLRKLT
jgi:hypothetical protein